MSILPLEIPLTKKERAVVALLTFIAMCLVGYAILRDIPGLLEYT